MGRPGRYKNVRRCGFLSMIPLQLEDSFELFMKRRGFVPGYEFLIILS